MEMLFWQAAIIISVSGSFFLKYSFRDDKNAGFLVVQSPYIFIVLWAFWTMWKLEPPLETFQLSVVGLTGFLGYRFYKTKVSDNQKIDFLKEAIKDAAKINNPNFNAAIERDEVRSQAESEFKSKIYPINGVKELRAELISSLQIASNRVLIMSGWASSYVIDKTFQDLCLTLLSKRVQVHLAFGFDSSSEKPKSNWQIQGKQQIANLMHRALENRTDDNLFVYEFDNHYKSLVVDEKYFVTGSFNWLSNSRGSNFERMWKNEIPDLVEREFSDCLGLMKRKRLVLRRKLLKPFIDWEDYKDGDQHDLH